MKIVVDSNIPFIEGVFENFAEVLYLKGDQIDRAAVVDATVLIVRTRTRCDRALLEGSSVELIATATIGYDHVDVDYLRSRGIEFVTAAGCNASGVLNYVMTLLVWADKKIKTIEPQLSTLGVIGVGNVGSRVAEAAARCGFRVLRCDPPRARAEGAEGFVSLDQLLRESDIVSCHVPLIREGEDRTYGMASAEFFAQMPKGAIFINSSRGEVVVDAELKDALRSGHICSAIIDTWNNEPTIDLELLEMSSLSTPHVAGYSLQGKANGSSMVVRAVARRYNLPLLDWYPDGVEQVGEQPQFCWSWLKERALEKYNIEAESSRLKQHAETFESMRNSYNYREEYF